MHHLNGNVSTPVFDHLGSSSWHDYDAHLFKILTHPSRWPKKVNRTWQRTTGVGRLVIAFVVIAAGMCTLVAMYRLKDAIGVRRRGRYLSLEEGNRGRSRRKSVDKDGIEFG